jgi:predicted MFS family arabinose efflux permease
LPGLVGDDERALVGANSVVWSAAVVSQVVLAPAAGALVAVAGAGAAFAVNAASFLVSAVLVAGLPEAEVPAVTGAGRRASMVREGFQAIRASRFLSTLAGAQALAALSAGATSALLVVLAERRLHVGAARFGLLLGAIGVGAALGPLALQRVMASAAKKWLLFGPYLVRGAVDMVLATVPSFGVAAGALGVYGVATSTGMVTYNSVLQATVPDSLRGRVFSFYDVVWQAARLASITAGGLLADWFGVRAVYYLGGLLLVAAGVTGLRRVASPSLA